MVEGRIRARVLLCRALGVTVPAPRGGESMEAWGERVLHAAGLSAALRVNRPSDRRVEVLPMLAAVSAALPDGGDEAAAMLATIAEQGDARKGRGVYYTARDVCDHVAMTCVVPATTHPAQRSRSGPVRVLDPTCGSGAFLRAAARVIDECRRDHVMRLRSSGDVAGQALVHGVDLDPLAVECCRLLLALDARSVHPARDWPAIDAAIARNVRVGDAITDARWHEWFPEAMRTGGFDAVIGNPPYVRQRPADHPKLASLRTHQSANAYAWVTERALGALAPGGRLGLVVPVSLLCADALAPCRAVLDDACTRVWAASFDAVPSTLFPGTVQRVAIITAERRRAARGTPAQWLVTRYHKWKAAERGRLLTSIRYVERPPHTVNGSVPKVGTQVEHRILDRVFAHPPAGELFARGGGDHPNCFHYKRRWSYYLLFTDFLPPIYDADGAPREPTEFKRVDVIPTLDARVLLAAYSSSLFHWFFTVFSDNRNVNRRELAAFPFAMPTLEVARELASLGSELMDALRASAKLRTCTYRSIGTIRNTYFRQAQARPVMDRVDAVLARHYGFDDEALAFLLDFERAFRAPGTPSVMAQLRHEDVHHDRLAGEQQRRERGSQHERQQHAAAREHQPV